MAKQETRPNDASTPLLDFPGDTKAFLSHAEDCAWTALARYGIQRGDREMWVERRVPLREAAPDFGAASRILNNVHYAEEVIKRLDREGHLDAASVDLLVHHVAVIAQALIFATARKPETSGTNITRQQVPRPPSQDMSTQDLLNRLEVSLRRIQQMVGDESH